MSAVIDAQLRQAIVTIRALKEQVRQLTASGKGPIAVVGIGCRFPGGAVDPAALWRMLLAGVDAIGTVPPERWDADAWFDPDPDAIGKMSTRWGGFLADIDRFDPAFFDLSAREAAAMDPQQRMLLEVTWEALEHAAIAPDSLQGSATGVFVGINGSDYYHMAMSEPAAIDAHALSGSVASIAAGRLSYLLGLNGPSMAVDTACSSSLTAVHLALQSLRSGESRVALAGGSYAVLQPNLSVGLSRLHMMAADGRCKSFDAAADGFVQGEGCAMVVLKRLDDAIADQDTILAVIRGSAMNQDGRSSSLTAPSRSAQVAVMRAALADAGMTPQQIGYVETHGTGTALGDPIELHALADVLGRERMRPVLLGALKSNIGHLGPAAGIAGLVKAVLALGAGVVPPNLHLRQLNPAISLDGFPALFPQALASWPAGEGLRAAGVSSFGFSGTNVHVVLEQAPPAAVAETQGAPGWSVLFASARSEAALTEVVARLAATLTDGADLTALSRTCLYGRRAFEYGAYFLVRTPAQARAALAEAACVRSKARPRLALWFGAHARDALSAAATVRSARLLCAAYPEMAATLALAARALPALHGMLEGDAPVPAAPAQAALQWAVLEQLRAWRVAPALCSGAGLGELAAGAAAGLLDWPAVLVALDGPTPASLAALRPRAGPAVALFAGSTGDEPLERLSPHYLAALAGPPAGMPGNARAWLDCTVVLSLAAGPATLAHAPLHLQLDLHGDPLQQMLEALAGLHAHGLKPDWRRVLGPGRRAPLPLYPFQRASYWRAPATSAASADALPTPTWPPGQRVNSPTLDAQFCLALGVERLPWLGDHRVHGLAVVPGAFQIACLTAAWREMHGNGPCVISELTFERPLIAPESGTLALWTTLTPQGKAQLCVPSGAGWQIHAQGTMSSRSSGAGATLALDALRLRCNRPIGAQQWRTRLAGLGIEIGPAFQGIRKMWEGAGEALAEVALQPGLATHGEFHPALLDACVQTAGGALSEQTRNGEALLPIGIDRVTLLAPLRGTLWVHARSTAQGEVLSTDLTLADEAGQVLATIEGLHVRRAPLQLLHDEPSQALFHWAEWRRAPLSAPAGLAQAPLVVAADAAAGLELIACLAVPAVLATPGARLREVAHGHWEVPAGELGALLARLPAGTEVIDLHAWSCTDPTAGSALCRDVLGTVQALLAMAAPPRLWLVTREALLETRFPGQAALSGLYATAMLEHPELDWRRVDADALAGVAAEVGGGDSEAISAWRQGVRRIPRLLQRRPPRAPERQAALLRDTVLITGAMGGIGSALAAWAVASGARQLVLTGRSANPADADALSRTLGVPVRVLACDLGQREQVEQLLAQMADLAPLRAVFHAAGVQAEGMLATLPSSRFNMALQAKLDGAWWLHLATRGMALDHFVLFSSLASTVGAAGQGGYAAANAGLDGLARYRRANGLPALSVQWGRWDGAGMAGKLDDNAQRRIDALGILPMAPALALSALTLAMAGDVADPLVAAVDWDRYRARQPAAPRLLDELGSGRQGAAPVQALAPAALAALPPEARAAALLELLGEHLRSVLGWQGGQALDSARPLVQLGVDSLLAMELRSRMQRDLGQASSIAELLGGSSLREVADALSARFAGPQAEAGEWEEFIL